jgi:hypothetical protein
MIINRKNFVTRGEVWFDDDPHLDGVDLVEYYYRSNPLEGCRCVDYRTLVIDLTQDEKTLMANIQSDTRRYIRRMAESPDIVYESWNPANEQIADRLLAAYEELAAQKKLPAVDRNLIAQYARSGRLDVSYVRKTDGTPLSWHSYFRTPERSRLLQSIALFRADSADPNLVGRAHRYHTWRDIQRFKEAGIPVLDMGGWYSGKSDEELLRINEFKAKFGGRVVADYLCERPLTIKGKLYAGLRRLLRAGLFNNQPVHDS